MSTVSLIVRALNEANHIGNLLDAVKGQHREVDEVIVVDSGSTDATVEIAASYGARIVDIAPHDFSFGRALNLGCQHATGDLLVFASAHVYPCDDMWLEHLLAPFEDEEIVLTYGRQTGDERTQFSELQLMRRWFPDKSDLDQAHPFCNNANCAVRRTAWESLPYDESLTGLEDVQWAHRARARGHRLAYVAEAPVVHVHEESFLGTYNRYRREAIAHRAIFGGPGLGRGEAFGLLLANVARDYLAAIPRRKLLRNLWSIPRFRTAQFWAAVRGSNEQQEVTLALKRRLYYPKGLSAFDRWRSLR